MAKTALITTVGSADQGLNLVKPYTRVAELPILKHGDSSVVSIHEFLDALKKLRLEPRELEMDLLVIAVSIYAADTRLSRQKFADDSWTRQIDLYIPVSDPDFWNMQIGLLQKIVTFLTGDIWHLNFRARTAPDLEISPRGNRKKYGMPYETDTVCLFSGGMDSFIGAVDLLERNVRPLLIGHAKSNDVSAYQHSCHESLKDHYLDRAPHRIYSLIRIPKEDLFETVENSERGRSFLFLTIGMISASCLNTHSNLIMPENGMISLNLPLTPLRVGSHSTRTTHPHYLSLMQQLFDNMGSGVRISNPYQFMTKGEMLDECLNKQLVENTNSMSCSHPDGRWEGQGSGHCGYCVPCLIRQAAFKRAGLTDKASYRHDIFDSAGLKINSQKGTDVLAFKYMIEKVSQKPDFLKASVRNTGPLGLDVDDFVDTYNRALVEVGELINTVRLI